MWKTVSQLLADQFGSYYNIKSKVEIVNGETHKAWLINDGHIPVFVKTNLPSYRSMFRTEADELELLASSGTIKVPAVYAVGCTNTESFILLEGFDLKPFNNQHMAEFGAQIASLHLWQDQEHYGLDFDTWLGPIHQPNDWKSNWATFFSENRIGWQLQLCKEKNIIFTSSENEIIELVAKRLHKHQPIPSLLHGDLWRGNCGLIEDDERILVFDPACYWGDRECDLAYTELHDPFPPEFYLAYNNVYPIDPNYELRKPIYQLYYLLNLSHRFGGKHIEIAQTIITQLINKDI